MIGKSSLILAGFLLFSLLFPYLFYRFLDRSRGQWQRSWRGPVNDMIAVERYARARWWCPARRNRSVATGVAGFNLSIFPINIQWRHRFIAWLFPYFFWMTLDRHGRCLGSGCAVWRWEEGVLGRERRGWCGLANRPADPEVPDIQRRGLVGMLIFILVGFVSLLFLGYLAQLAIYYVMDNLGR